MVTENIILTNHDFAKFSLVPLEGYRKWEDYMANEFKGYKLNDIEMSLNPETAPVQSFEKVIKALTHESKEGNEDTQAMEQITKEWKYTYIQGEEGKPHHQVYLASLMRCGNSLFRRILEKVTSTYVGAPFNTLLTGCFSTLLQGFTGENQVDQKVFLIKTHYPYIYPFCKPISACRSLVLIRNPFDTMVSIW